MIRALRIAFAVGTIAFLSNPLAAVDLPRGTLWRVEQTCMWNERTTGSPFPCLKVDEQAGYAVLRAPFRQTHIVTMPTARITGVEDPALQQPGGPNYFADAWGARSFVHAELKRPLSNDDVGLAVNSRLTRSQDQLHIHVDCVDRRVKRLLAAKVADIPADAWQPDAFSFEGQSYWGRRVAAPDLQGVDVFTLADTIPSIHAHPARTILAVLGVKDPNSGGSGFVLLAGQSDPWRGAAQSTSEDLLDHGCRRDP